MLFLVLGLTGLVTAGVLWLLRPDATPAGVRLGDVQIGADVAAQPGPVGPVPAAGQPGVGDRGATASASGGAAASPDGTQVADPVRVLIPSIGVDAPTVSLAVSEDVLAGPEQFSDAGWWADGPEPGEAGAAVIAGHVDSYQGPAVFFDLHELTEGDVVTVERGDGSRVDFAVTGSERYAKDGIPVDRVFGETLGPTLRLITCGGEFDRSAKSYVDNLVVYAVPV